MRTLQALVPRVKARRRPSRTAGLDARRAAGLTGRRPDRRRAGPRDPEPRRADRAEVTARLLQTPRLTPAAAGATNVSRTRIATRFGAPSAAPKGSNPP